MHVSRQTSTNDTSLRSIGASHTHSGTFANTYAIVVWLLPRARRKSEPKYTGIQAHINQGWKPVYPWHMRDLYGVRVGRKTINNRLVARGYHAHRILKKTQLTVNHRLDWAWRWQNLTVAAWSHVFCGDESRFQLYPVDGHMSLSTGRMLLASLPGCQGPSWRGFCPCLRGIPQGRQITPCAPR